MEMIGLVGPKDYGRVHACPIQLFFHDCENHSGSK